MKLKSMLLDELKRMSVAELEKLCQQKMDELFLVRKELDRRTGRDVKPSVEVDYTKYVTK